MYRQHDQQLFATNDLGAEMGTGGRDTACKSIARRRQTLLVEKDSLELFWGTIFLI